MLESGSALALIHLRPASRDFGGQALALTLALSLALTLALSRRERE